RAHGGVQVRLLEGRGAAHKVDVLGGFLFQHVQDVVGADDAQEPSRRVHHRQRHEVVLAQQARRFLSRRLGLHRHDFRVHDVGQQRVVGAQQNVTKGRHAHQPADVVHDVNVVGNVDVFAYFAKVGDDL